MPDETLEPPLDARDIDEVFARSEWAELRGARVLVTGGTGFFGKWLIEPLLAAEDRLGLGVRAVLLTRDPRAFARIRPYVAGHPAITLLGGDVRSFALDAPVTHVVHAATGNANLSADPADMAATIVAGTARVLAAVGRAPMLYVSSGAVYGPATGAIPEDFEGEPTSVYAVGKRAAEGLCAGRAVIARPFAFLAPGLPLDAGYAAGDFIADAVAGRPIEVCGDGRAVRTWQYGTDLAVSLWRLLLAGTPGRAYNVGADHAVPIGELARRIGAAAGVPVRILGTASADRASGYVPDTSRIRAELGVTSAVDLDAAIARTLAWALRPAGS